MKPHRFRLDRETGITITTPSRPGGIRLDPGHHYTTDDPEEIDMLKGHPDLTEVKIPKPE